jgi:hypothetical protein
MLLQVCRAFLMLQICPGQCFALNRLNIGDKRWEVHLTSGHLLFTPSAAAVAAPPWGERCTKYACSIWGQNRAHAAATTDPVSSSTLPTVTAMVQGVTYYATAVLLDPACQYSMNCSCDQHTSEIHASHDMTVISRARTVGVGIGNLVCSIGGQLAALTIVRFVVDG